MCAPEVLVIFLHRFLNLGFYHSKVNFLVDFPVNGLDLTDYMDTTAGYFQSGWDQSPIYDLGVMVQHGGDSQLKNKYVTIARHMPEDKWFEYDDQAVREVSVKAVKRTEALMLFYIKRKPKPHKAHEGGTSADILQEMLRQTVLSRREAIVKEKQHVKQIRRQRLEREKQSLLAEGDNAVLNAIVGKLRLMTFGRSAVDKDSQSTGVMAPNSKWHIVKKSLSRVQELKDAEGGASDTNATPAAADGGGLTDTADGPGSAAITASDVIGNEPNSANSLGSEGSMRVASPSKSSASATWKRWKRMGGMFGGNAKVATATSRDDIGTIDTSDLIIRDAQPENKIYISYLWILKFLSMTAPGPICNDDISCPHGHLKPHMHGCKKIACIPVDRELVRMIEFYLKETYGFPTREDGPGDTEVMFRHLMWVVPNCMCANNVMHN